MAAAAQVVAQAAAVVAVVDGEGRRLEVRRPSALERLRVLKAVGPVGAMNDRYLGVAMLAACVVSVDGVPLPFPGNEAAVEASVARLGDAGLEAAAGVLGAEEENEPGN